jgi:hypothetical protein
VIRARERPAGEEGSFTFAMLIWVLLFLFLMTLVIDGSMEVSAKEQAANVADSIARNVADDVDVGDLRDDGKVTINNSNGLCLSGDVSRILGALPGNAGNLSVPAGDCQVNGNSVTVTVSITYTPLLWGSNVNASATAFATAVTGPTN